MGAVRLLRFVPLVNCDDATINQFIAERDKKLEGLPMQQSKTYLEVARRIDANLLEKFDARPRVIEAQWLIQRLLAMIAMVMMTVRACAGGEHLRILQLIEELALDQETC